MANKSTKKVSTYKSNENEEVVNRFLLSTVYIIVAAMGLYYLNNMATASMNFMAALNIFVGISVVGAVGTVWFIIRKFVLKKGTLYPIVLCAVFIPVGLFLRWGNYIPGCDDMTRRFMLVGVVAALLYIYELIVYFLRVNKTNKK